MGTRFAVAALVNSVFINVHANMAAGAFEKTWAYFLLVTNYSQFILNQYQEVGQTPAYTATPKN